MSTLSDKVLNKIRNEKLAPRPRWLFLLRDGGRWLGLVVLISLAVVAVGLLIYFWSDGPWLHGGRLGLGLLFGRMPLVLLAIVLIGSAFALVDFKNIGRGYRHSLLMIGSIVVVLAVACGWLFHYLGFSRGLDSAISKAPFYQDRQMYMMQVWQNPGDGLIAGKITQVTNNQDFILLDFTGKLWKIDASKTLWRHNLTPGVNLDIKLIGTAKGDNFKADEVRPWMGGGGCGMMAEQGACGMRQ